MTDYTHRTKIIGWAKHASKDSIEIPDSESEYYTFGHREKGSGNFPSKNFNINSEYVGSRDPVHSISKIEPVAGVGFNPTNGLEFYYAFGNVGNAGTSPDAVHTVAGIHQGTLPSRVIRYQSENADQNIREEAINCKTKTLNFQLFNVNRNIESPVVIATGFQATDVRPASYGGSLEPVFPSDKEEMYFADKSNFVFEWDAAAVIETIGYEDTLMNFQYLCDMTNRFQPLVQQLAPHAILDGVRTHVLIFDMMRGDSTRIYTDHQDQDLPKDRVSPPKDLKLRCYAKGSTTEYMQLYFNDVVTSKVDMNDADIGNNEADTYKIVAVAASVIPTIKDGVADSFYVEV